MASGELLRSETEGVTWSLPWSTVKRGYKAKTTSAAFGCRGLPAREHFVLELYVDGCSEVARGHCGVFVRYCGSKSRVTVAITLTLGSRRLMVDAVLGLKADAVTRTRAGSERFAPTAALEEFGEESLELCCELRLTDGSTTRISFGDMRESARESGEELILDDEDETHEPATAQKGLAGTQFLRNMKFTVGVAPIVLHYLSVRKKAGKLRKQIKKNDASAYYAEREAMLDVEHQAAAVAVRELFESMGGLYNKLAQDFATRDGLLPAAWVEELKGSFEAMPPRSWPVISKQIYAGLANEGVAPLDASFAQGDLRRFYLSIEHTCLAAASIGQVHVATTHASANLAHGQRVVVKAVYPEIRKNLAADLLNARRAMAQISSILKLPMKGTIDAIMDEQCANFPKELDLRIEARHLRKAQQIHRKHGVELVTPTCYDELSSSSVLTQSFLDGVTLASFVHTELAGRDADLKRVAAVNAVTKVAHAIGISMFREGFFHSDPHPGNVMLLRPDFTEPGLIDFGQCMRLEKEQLRTICHVICLLRTKSPALIDLALAQNPEFQFSTPDVELKMALLYYFFDSSPTGAGVVRAETMEYLRQAIQHNPKIMPVLSDTPREMIFYGRVCGTLKKSFELLGADISVVALWYPEARAALSRLNAEHPKPVSSALLLLPENPDGLAYLVRRAPVWAEQTLALASRFGELAQKETLLAGIVPAGLVPKRGTSLLHELAAAAVLVAALALFVVPLLRGLLAALAMLIATALALHLAYWR